MHVLVFEFAHSCHQSDPDIARIIRKYERLSRRFPPSGGNNDTENRRQAGGRGRGRSGAREGPYKRMDFITASHIDGRNNVVQIVTCTDDFFSLSPSLVFYPSLSLSLSLALHRIYTGNAFSTAPHRALPDNEEAKLERKQWKGRGSRGRTDRRIEFSR